MTTLPTYEGWSNYPTWAVNLWLTNDEGLYDSLLAQLRGGWGESGRHRLAESLRLWVEDFLPDLGSSLGADLLGWAVAYVDWQELADHYIVDFFDSQ